MTQICMVVQNYYDIDPRVRRESEALIEAGHQVDVLALRMEGHPDSEYDLNGVHVVTLELPKKRGAKSQYIFEYLYFFLWALWTVTVRTLKYHYRIIHVNTLPDALVFCGLFARPLGAKLILDMHEIMPEFFMSKYQVPETHWMIRILKVLENWSMKFADHVLTINEPIQTLLEGRGLKGNKSTVIMNSGDDRLFQNKAEALKTTPEDTGKFIFMYHGTLTPIYGLDLAVEAFGKACERMPGAELWIVGGGPESARLAEIAQAYHVQDQVRLIGMLPQQEIPAYLQRCHAGVLATRQDVFLDYSFSNKLPEYIMMGKPVIASRLKAIRHYFSEEALVYFEPNNTQDLAKKMEWLYNNRSQSQTFLENAQKEYQQINWGVMKKRYLALVDRLVNA